MRTQKVSEAFITTTSAQLITTCLPPSHSWRAEQTQHAPVEIPVCLTPGPHNCISSVSEFICSNYPLFNRSTEDEKAKHLKAKKHAYLLLCFELNEYFFTWLFYINSTKKCTMTSFELSLHGYLLRPDQNISTLISNIASS